MSKRMFCEHCSPWAAECVVCDGYARRDEIECDAMRWADDGGRVIDPDADTVPAETLPEVSALTLAEVRALDPDERADWVVFALVFVGSTAWLGAAAFTVGRYGGWW